MTLSAEFETGLPLVLADYARILRVFSNLIVNAVKFSGASGKYALRLRAASKGPCALV